MKFIIPIGTAACGKTQYYNTQLKSQYKDWNLPKRISADEIRFKKLNYPETGVDFDPNIEPQVWEKLWSNLVDFADGSNNIYLDCTNLTRSRRSPFIHFARANDYTIEMVRFNIPLDLILYRNKNRHRRLEEKIILNQFLKLEEPEPWEYDKLVEWG